MAKDYTKSLLILVAFISFLTFVVLIFAGGTTGQASKVFNTKEQVLRDDTRTEGGGKNCFSLNQNFFYGTDNLTIKRNTWGNNTGCFELMEDVQFNYKIILDSSEGEFIFKGANNSTKTISTMSGIKVPIGIEINDPSNEITVEYIKISNRSNFPFLITNGAKANLNHTQSYGSNTGVRVIDNACVNINNSTHKYHSTGYYIQPSNICKSIINNSVGGGSIALNIKSDSYMSNEGVEITGFTATGSIGIRIEDTPNVNLSNVTINDITQKGIYGIDSKITLSDSTITGNGSNEYGIHFINSGNKPQRAQLDIKNVTVSNNNQGVELFWVAGNIDNLTSKDNFSGLKISDPITSGALIFLSVKNTKIINNSSTGIYFNGVKRTQIIFDKLFVNNNEANGIFVNTVITNFELKNSVISNNSSNGIAFNLTEPNNSFLINNVNLLNNGINGLDYYSTDVSNDSKKFTNIVSKNNVNDGFKLNGKSLIEKSIAQNNSRNGFTFQSFSKGQNITSEGNGRNGVEVIGLNAEISEGVISCNNAKIISSAKDIFGNNSSANNLTGDFYYDSMAGNSTVNQIGFCSEIIKIIDEISAPTNPIHLD
jgi:hypothetical protein